MSEPVSSNKEVLTNFELFSAGYDAAVEDIITSFENLDNDKGRWAAAIIRGATK
jgi:hypothetical protein